MYTSCIAPTAESDHSGLHFPGVSFAMLEAKCPGVSITHTHAAWGQT